MKREAVQEERQRGAKLQPKQNQQQQQQSNDVGGGNVVGGIGVITGDDTNPTSSVCDLSIDRIKDAEELSESRPGDNAIPYLRVGPNSMVPQEYKVNAKSQRYSNAVTYLFTEYVLLGGSLALMSNGQQAAISTHRVCPPDALLRAAAA